MVEEKFRKLEKMSKEDRQFYEELKAINKKSLRNLDSKLSKQQKRIENLILEKRKFIDRYLAGKLTLENLLKMLNELQESLNNEIKEYNKMKEAFRVMVAQRLRAFDDEYIPKFYKVEKYYLNKSQK